MAILAGLRGPHRASHILVAAVTLGGLLLAAPGLGQPAAASARTAPAHTVRAQTETQLSESGWTASSNTNSSPGDSPQNAISGNTGARFSSDADQAPGMWWQVNMGSV